MRARAVLAIACLAAAALGEPRPVVSVEPPAKIALAPGATAEARLTVVVANGFHLQANPASEKYLVSTRLEFAKDPDVQAGRPIYPPGRPYRLPGASGDLSTYEGRFEIRLPLEASLAAKVGGRVLTGRLYYQACDARTCLFPASVPVTLLVTVK